MKYYISYFHENCIQYLFFSAEVKDGEDGEDGEDTDERSALLKDEAPKDGHMKKE